jgi:hypothetical protein
VKIEKKRIWKISCSKSENNYFIRPLRFLRVFISRRDYEMIPPHKGTFACDLKDLCYGTEIHSFRGIEEQNFSTVD